MDRLQQERIARALMGAFLFDEAGRKYARQFLKEELDVISSSVPWPLYYAAKDALKYTEVGTEERKRSARGLIGYARAQLEGKEPPPVAQADWPVKAMED